MKIIPIPAFQDNYIWLLSDGPNAVVVDPGDAEPVMRHLEDQGLSLTAILLTHHHADHVGGVAKLLSCRPVPVFGPLGSPYPGITHPLSDGERIAVPGLACELSVMAVPGHTLDHIAYYGDGRLFCGDTLFACGCGRLFEGSPEQMHVSLSRLAALPGPTEVYCTHEYTLSNQRFALAVEPDNLDLQQRHAADSARRDKGEATLPSSIELEHRTNPFLRASLESVRQAAEQHAGHPLPDACSVFATLRAWKDGFRG